MNRRWSTCLAIAVLLGACSSEGSDDADSVSTSAPSTTASPTTEGPTTTTTTTAEDDVDPVDESDCLGAEDVADVVGSQVDRAPSVGVSSGTDGLSYSTEGCSYDLADGAGSVSVGRITPDESAGEGSFYLRLEAKAESEAIEDGFEAVTDLGDDAYRDGPDIVVRYGDRIMFVGFDSFGDVDDEELNDRIDVATVVARALVPLDLDQDEATQCTGIEDVVADKVGTVGSTGTSSKSVNIGDVSISAEGCVLDLQDGRVLAVSIADGDQWDAWVETRQSSSFTDAFTPTSLGELSAYDTGDALVVNEGELPLLVETSDLDLDTAAAATLREDLARLALGR